MEDEIAVAFLIEDMLADLGHQVIGLATRLSQALQMAKHADFDFAILDINLAGEMSFPVADVLAARGVPFMFASAYGSAGLSPAWRGRARVMRKPFDLRELSSMIDREAA